MSQPIDPTEPVATGDRREEVRFERDRDQLVRMRATFPVEGPLPRELVPQATAEGAPSPDLPTDVAVTPDAPSAWDARPPDEGEQAPDS